MDEIKLSTYLITYRENNTRNTSNKQLAFSSFTLDNGNEVNFFDIFQMIVDTFDNKFRTTKERKKAMRLLSENLSFGSEKRIITGSFRGGATGSTKEVYDTSKDKDQTPIYIEDKHVYSDEYYFLLWLPLDSQVGIFIVQGTASESSADLFKTILQLELKKILKKHTVKIERYIPKSIVKKFESDSKITSIKLTKNRYASDGANNVLGAEIFTSPVTIEISIKGINDTEGRIKEFLKGKLFQRGTDTPSETAKFFSSDMLENIGFGEYYDESINLTGANRKTATPSTKNGFKIKPFTYLSEEEFERDAKDKVVPASMIEAIKRHFKEVKDEIIIIKDE